ncbi:hypothetical protein Emed_005716 [Eimeria media]
MGAPWAPSLLVFEEKGSSDPYAFIDEHVKRPSGTQQQQTERLERELEQLQVTVRKKIDWTLVWVCATQRCFEEAEEKSLCLSRALPEALATVETLGSEASRSQAAAKRLLASLEATGAHQQKGLGTLYVLQAVKKHLEDCSKIVAELHRWHFRVQEAELLLQSLRPNSLLEASQQRAVVEAAAVSASLRHAASLLASLPEFESRMHAAKKLEQRVLSLATLLLRDSVSANSTEGFGCAVSAFESLGAQETLARELPAALRSLLQKAWKTLWLQTPAGRTEETDEEGQLLPHEESQLHAQQEHYNPSVGCVAEPEALMAYAEQPQASFVQPRPQWEAREGRLPREETARPAAAERPQLRRKVKTLAAAEAPLTRTSSIQASNVVSPSHPDKGSCIRLDVDERKASYRTHAMCANASVSSSRLKSILSDVASSFNKLSAFMQPEVKPANSGALWAHEVARE